MKASELLTRENLLMRSQTPYHWANGPMFDSLVIPAYNRCHYLWLGEFSASVRASYRLTDGSGQYEFV